MEQDNRQTIPTPPPMNQLAVLSLVAGIFAVISCCLPPMQLLLGVTAVILAVVSKKGKPFSGMAVAGLVLGIIAAIVSILVFFYFLFVMDLMQDPAYASMFQEVMDQYEQVFEQMQ